MSAADVKGRPRPDRGGMSMGEVYRLCRMLHAYLSAFAFLALLFFALTGLTLNHPSWLAGHPPEQARPLQLSKTEVDAALRAPDPGPALAALVQRQTPLKGRYASAEVLEGEALLRFEGPTGVSDVVIQTATGETEVGMRPAGLVAMLNDLHKGKATGTGWRWLIDVCAVLFILLSVIGYVLFFSLRFRLRTSLVLTAASLAVLVGAFVLLVA